MNNTRDKICSYDLLLIIPFFNEEKRIEKAKFEKFASSNKNILLVLVNDGSSDQTGSILSSISSQYPDNVKIVNTKKNLGKSNAIRDGILSVNEKITYTGYLDGDLSTSFESFLPLFSEIKASNADAVFGSRIKKMDTHIERSAFRHVTGRIVATLVDNKFNIGCYDTQCGAKLFKTELLRVAIEKPFFTKWFFDIEIILRLKKNYSTLNIAEIPLNSWIHKKGSKISFWSTFSVIKELMTLFSKYNNQ